MAIAALSISLGSPQIFTNYSIFLQGFILTKYNKEIQKIKKNYQSKEVLENLNVLTTNHVGGLWKLKAKF